MNTLTIMDIANKYFHNMCRTCMHEICVSPSFADKQWRNMFDIISECEGLSVANLLSSTVPTIKVHKTDQMPKKMCLECLEQLKNSYSFQKMCLHADQQIHEMIAKVKIDLRRKKSVSQGGEWNMLCVKIPAEAIQSTSAEERSDVESSEIDFNEYIKTEPNIDNQTIQPSTSEIAVLRTEQIPETTSVLRCDVRPMEYTNKIQEKFQSIASDVQITVKNEPCMEEEFIAECSNEKIDEKPMGLGSSADSYRLKCVTCNRLFYDLESLQNHSLSHENSVPATAESTHGNNIVTDLYSANDCQTGSSSEKFVASSMVLDSYPCDFCKKLFSSKHSLRKHKNYNCAQKSMKQYPCKECNKTFNNYISLRNHLRIHTGERPYVCPDCGKSFIHSGSLRLHRFSHSGVKPFECPICPLKFHHKGNLSKHKQVHDGSKTHSCDVCGKSFTTSSYLSIHKKFHNGEKSYKCDQCDMRFVQMTAQRLHMRTHTGEKPYKCKYCDHAFAQSCSLLKHLRIHLGDMIHRCELCPSAFRLASELRTHSAKHKTDDEETRERNLKALKEAKSKLEIKSLSRQKKKLK